MTVTYPVLAATAITLALVGQLDAQRPDRPDATAGIHQGPPAQTSSASALCWHARPKSSCGAFLVTNFGAYYDLPIQSVSNGRIVADWGLMVNVSPRDAVGASFLATVKKGGGFETGPEVRYRRWLGATGALEIAAGAGSLSGNSQEGSVVFGLVDFMPEHWIGVALRPELVRRRGDVSRLRVSAGVEVGWVPGVVVPALGVVIGLVALLANPPSFP